MVSNTDFVSRELDALHTKHTNNAEFSRRQLSLWAEAISSHQKTKEDFAAYVAELPEYKNAKLERFKEVFLRETDEHSSENDEASFNAFLGKRNKTILEDLSIVAYVRGLEPCDAVWRVRIKKAAEKRDVEDYDANTFLGTFQKSTIKTATLGLM